MIVRFPKLGEEVFNLEEYHRQCAASILRYFPYHIVQSRLMFMKTEAHQVLGRSAFRVADTGAGAASSMDTSCAWIWWGGYYYFKDEDDLTYFLMMAQ